MRSWEKLFESSIFGTDGESGRVVQFLGPIPGIFIDVGANHPFESSQSYALECAGWRGVLVEPLEEMAAALRVHRESPVECVACGAPEDAGTEKPLLVAGALSTFARRIMQAGAMPSAICMVPVQTVDQIVEKHGLAAIDFLSVDVEGYELDVLRGVSLDRWRPRLILMEDDVRSLAKHRHLVRHGYRLVRRTGLNGWYVPRAADFPVSPFGRWQLLRKYYLGLPPRWLRSWLTGVGGSARLRRGGEAN